MDDASELGAGGHLGKYRLDRLLGRGGMGEVWAAYDPDLDRNVALKVLRPSAAATDDARMRLLREGRAMARLRHPNVITVYDAITADGRDVIVMELVDGRTMAEWLATTHPRREVIDVVLAAGRGLAAAHAAGMIHRDFKPHNVLIDGDGRVLVTDFGLARATVEGVVAAVAAVVGTRTASASASAGSGSGSVALDDTLAAVEGTLTSRPSLPRVSASRSPSPSPAVATAAAPPSGSSARTTQPRSRSTTSDSDARALDSTLTRTGTLLGTPAYMAPELFRGGDADARTDQFAFCVSAWQALTGARPFEGSDLATIASATERDPIGAERLPRRLRAPLRRGLARERDARWPTMTALLRVLDRAWRRPRRIASALAIAVGVAAIALMIAMRGGTRAADPCADSRAAMDQVWSAAVRSEVMSGKQLKDQNPLISKLAGESLRRTSNAQMEIIDHWVETWRKVDGASCKQVRSSEALAERGCLEALRDDLAAMLDLRTRIPYLSTIIGDVSRSLPWPTVCEKDPRGVVAALPADPALRARAHDIEMQLMSLQLPYDGDVAFMFDVKLDPAVDQAVADAQALAHPPLIAEALLLRATATMVGARHSTDDGQAGYERAYRTYGDALDRAEAAGHDRVRARALLGQLECALRLPERHGEVDPLARRAGAAVEHLGDPTLEPALARLRAEAALAAGQWSEAITQADRAATRAAGTGVKASELPALLVGCRARVLRHAGDDLARAEALVSLGKDGDDVPQRFQAPAVIQRAWLEWRRGDGDAAALMLSPMVGDPAHPVTIKVTAVDPSGAAATYVDLAAAVDPIVFSRRLVFDGPFHSPVEQTSTGLDAVATLDAPGDGLVLARSDTWAGVAAVRRGDGPMTIKLAPAAAIGGRVTGLAAPVTADPTDPGGRAARRSLAVATATTRIGDTPLTFVAPVNADGTWRIESIPAGRYTVTVELTSALGDTQIAQATVAVPAGGVHPVDLALPAPVPLEVIARPAMSGLVIAVPGPHVPATVTELRTAMGASPWVTIVRAGAASTQAEDMPGVARIGDGGTWIGVPVGTVIACVVPRTTPAPLPPALRLTILETDAAPACRSVEVNGGTTTVVIGTPPP